MELKSVSAAPSNLLEETRRVGFSLEEKSTALEKQIFLSRTKRRVWRSKAPISGWLQRVLSEGKEESTIQIYRIILCRLPYY